ncbi:MAG: tRNA 5-methylaminomethyl-2-thiouridine biosynthesis bifunctional protein MnmC [Lentisphaerae bacterium ADurb.Bin242]|nr:MAG: tRNA 5-methylaminomethyl-2-thiouridine biosynthesis bifunctional protein MnmC [Lentisphaerae bacterium ADurb.Bin242]
MKRIRFFGDLLAERFGTPLHRIAFDLGLSCPNRADGSGPCAFCAADGSAARHLASGMSLAEQAERGKEYLRERYGSDGPYLAYFQAYTNTYADVKTLRSLYSEALKTADYQALVIATRPDCLDPECLDYLTELNHRYELWIELGVQTANDETLKRIRRGHIFADVRNAVNRLDKCNIRCAAHVILGLPGETRTDFLRTADELAKLPFSAVKLHHLLVLRGTPMAKMLHDGLVRPLNEYEYAQELALFLERLPEEVAVMRLSADAAPEEIIAPRWWMKKGQFREMFLRFFQTRTADTPFEFAPRTADGSYTLYHPGYRQYFHSTAGALTESVRKYIEPCRLPERLAQGESLRVLDIGFGMGFNASALARLVREIPRGSLSVISLEADPAVLKAAHQLPEHPDRALLDSVTEHSVYETDRFRLELRPGDARKTLPADLSFDAVFLDGFSPETNPELWTFEFLAALKQRMKPDALLATYSSAYPLFGALLENGFSIHESKPFGRRRGGTVAALCPQSHLEALSEKDLLIATRSTAGVPYSDPDLSRTREEILRLRQEKVARMRAEGIPKWFRRKT